jgi:predicted cupin superfamily sugar epimerase
MEQKDIVKTLNLIPHPEGGFYRETYRSEHSTAIYYLLEEGQQSSLHRIKSDEMWHFYSGDSIAIVEITEEGSVKETILDKTNLQYVVPANRWFGAYLPNGSKYALTGCTVSPAFQFIDFEMADKNYMLKTYPKAKNIIERLNR